MYSPSPSAACRLPAQAAQTLTAIPTPPVMVAGSLIRLPSFDATTSAYRQGSTGVAISEDGRTALLNQGGGVLAEWELR